MGVSMTFNGHEIIGDRVICFNSNDNFISGRGLDTTLKYFSLGQETCLLYSISIKIETWNG